jgi:hypothetical protein
MKHSVNDLQMNFISQPRYQTKVPILPILHHSIQAKETKIKNQYQAKIQFESYKMQYQAAILPVTSSRFCHKFPPLHYEHFVPRLERHTVVQVE